MTNRYIIKLWILSQLLAPFLYALYELIKEIPGQVVGLLEIFPITLIFSFFFSLPTLLAIYILNRLIVKGNFSEMTNKLLIVAFTLTGIIVTLTILGGSLVPTLIMIYSTSLILSALILEIKKPGFKKHYKT